MGSHGSPLPRFRRAIERRSLLLAETAAREAGHLPLEDAFAFVLLLRREGDARYERGALRWLARLLNERDAAVLLSDLATLVALLDELGTDVRQSALEELATVLRRVGLEAAAHAADPPLS